MPSSPSKPHVTALLCRGTRSLESRERSKPRAAHGRFTTHVLGHSHEAWATKVLGASMGTRPHSTGLCFRSGSAEPMPSFSDGICLSLFCAILNNPCFSFCGPSGKLALCSRLAVGPSRRAGLQVLVGEHSAKHQPLCSVVTDTVACLVLLSQGHWDNS